MGHSTTVSTSFTSDGWDGDPVTRESADCRTNSSGLIGCVRYGGGKLSAPSEANGPGCRGFWPPSTPSTAPLSSKARLTLTAKSFRVVVITSTAPVPNFSADRADFLPNYARNVYEEDEKAERRREEKRKRAEERKKQEEEERRKKE